MSRMTGRLASLTTLFILGWSPIEPGARRLLADQRSVNVPGEATLVVETIGKEAATVESTIFWLRIRNTSQHPIAVDKQLTFSKSVFFRLDSDNGTIYQSPGIASGVPREPVILNVGDERRYGPFDLAKLDVLDPTRRPTELRAIALEPGVYRLVVTYESHDAAAEKNRLEARKIRVPMGLEGEKRGLRITQTDAMKRKGSRPTPVPVRP